SGATLESQPGWNKYGIPPATLDGRSGHGDCDPRRAHAGLVGEDHALRGQALRHRAPSGPLARIEVVALFGGARFQPGCDGFPAFKGRSHASSAIAERVVTCHASSTFLRTPSYRAPSGGVSLSA